MRCIRVLQYAFNHTYVLYLLSTLCKVMSCEDFKGIQKSYWVRESTGYWYSTVPGTWYIQFIQYLYTVLPRCTGMYVLCVIIHNVFFKMRKGYNSKNSNHPFVLFQPEVGFLHFSTHFLTSPLICT